MQKILVILGLVLLLIIGYQFINNPEAATEPVVEDSLLEGESISINEMSETLIAEGITINPISHASAVLDWDGTIIYSDPVGDGELYSDSPAPDVIFITHQHGDHFNLDTLTAISKPGTVLITTAEVAEALPAELPGTRVVLANGETYSFGDITFEAIPSYNIREEALKNHPEGRDNGYLISDAAKRVYFSGDSEGTPEMRALENIDAAFIAMNLPYTMDVDAAAEAVLAFAPKKVYPYHFRTPEGFSDVDKFKSLVNEGNSQIEVVILDWYPE